MEDLGQKLYALQSIIMSLEARVSKIDAQVEMLDDDVGEADTPVGWGEGGGGGETDYAWKIRAVQAFDEENQPYDPPRFNVTVKGGSAQVLGGAEVVFEDAAFEEVPDGSIFFVRYNAWGTDGIGIHAWQSGIQYGSSVPSGTGGAKILGFALGVVGSANVGYVNQFRIGSIQSLLYVDASPSGDGFAFMDIS